MGDEHGSKKELKTKGAGREAQGTLSVRDEQAPDRSVELATGLTDTQRWFTATTPRCGTPKISASNVLLAESPSGSPSTSSLRTFPSLPISVRTSIVRACSFVERRT
jgi:hypothetical protein